MSVSPAAGLVGAFLVGAAAASAAVQPPQSLTHGRFESLRLHAAATPALGTALVLSGADGWTAQDEGHAAQLAARGALVAGIDTRAFLRSLEQDGGDCVFPAGDLENLSHFVQAYAQLPDYRAPVLAGRGAGAALAYAAAAQAADTTFPAVIGLGFCPELPLRKPLCDANRLRKTDASTQRGLTTLLPARAPRFAFLLLPDAAGPPCAAERVSAFASTTADPASLPETFLQLLRKAPPPPSPAVPAGVADLPLVELPAQEPAREDFAILISGDGGWAGLDQELAAALTKNGIAVIGLDSLRYFWSARSPEGLAADLHRLIQFYAAHWHKNRVLLLGYSQGGDVLPFALTRLPRASLERLALAVPMVPGREASFEFHLSNWIGKSAGLPILPELQKLSALPMLCIYGLDEAADSSCSRLDPQRFRVRALPGGHHFDGNYGLLADTILEAAGAR